ncbi:MAG TPA: hypothetical protein VFB74_09670 [Kribbellaceae bacterium]|nr:hypothetical protein [Kribbellaceae bacterium]
MNPQDTALPLGHAHVHLDQVRRKLLVAVYELRTLLINGDDLLRPADTALGEPLAGIAELAEVYRAARGDAEAQPGDLAAGLARRRYVNPGDTVLVVLPDTEHCRPARLSGRAPTSPPWTPNSTSPSAPHSCACRTPTPESTATRTPTGAPSWPPEGGQR